MAKTIPKQSRRRWHGTDVVANFYNMSTVDDLTVADLNLEEETETGSLAETTTTTTVCRDTDTSDTDITTEVTHIQSETAVDNGSSSTGTSHDDFYILPETEPTDSPYNELLNEIERHDTSPQGDLDAFNITQSIHDIPNGDESIRNGTDITKGQAVVTAMSFILRHRLTGTAVEYLLEMFDILAPGCLPPSKFLLSKGIISKGHEFDAHLYCPVCEVYLDRYSECESLNACHACDIPLGREQCLKDGNFYLYVSIENQLSELLKRHSLIKKSEIVIQDDLTSALSGRVIKEHFRKGEILDEDITLIGNCDGAPVFKSSKRSVWPLQACINELASTSTDNCLLIALWFSKDKPWSHCYLKPFAEELKVLGSDGMNWIDENGKTVHSRVFSLCASCDSCARPMLRNTTQFNGQYGCDWCLQKGDLIQRGDGFSMIYRPLETSPEKRHNVGFLQDALASSEMQPVYGVKGISPLLFLPLFNIVRGFVPDYLHCILLGVVRLFTGLWFDSLNHQQPWYIGNSMSEISHRLVNMKIPSNISRLPRSLSERKFWKGSEWKSFLLYYSLIVCDGKLPQQYLNHWFLLVYATHSLLQDKISSAEIDLADNALKEFVRKVPLLYDQEYCTFNVHQLLHIADAV